MEAKQLIPPELYQRIFNNIAALLIEMKIARLQKLIEIKENELKNSSPEIVYI